MSLINDALKRASQAENSRPPVPFTPTLMQPASEPHRSLLPTLFGIGAIVLLSVLGILVGYSMSHGRSPQPPVVRPPAAHDMAVTPPATNIEAAPAPIPVPSPAPPPPVAQAPPPTNTTVAPAMAAAAPPAPVAPAFPELKLQSIFYNRVSPKASINGRLRSPGDLFDDVRVIAITDEKVTVEWNGQTKDLVLQGN